MTQQKTRRAPKPMTRPRKRVQVEQELLQNAMRALGANTEVEAVTIALQRVVNNWRIAEGIRALGGSKILDESRINDP